MLAAQNITADKVTAEDIVSFLADRRNGGLYLINLPPLTLEESRGLSAGFHYDLFPTLPIRSKLVEVEVAHRIKAADMRSLEEFKTMMQGQTHFVRYSGLDLHLPLAHFSDRLIKDLETAIRIRDDIAEEEGIRAADSIAMHTGQFGPGNGERHKDYTFYTISLHYGPNVTNVFSSSTSDLAEELPFPSIAVWRGTENGYDELAKDHVVPAAFLSIEEDGCQLSIFLTCTDSVL